MKKSAILAAVVILVAFSLTTLALQNGYDLFQKALAKERAEGNLEEAISLYQQVIKEAKDESLSAKAQFRIGICYEKLGQKKAKLAQEAFQKVINEYPGRHVLFHVDLYRLEDSDDFEDIGLYDILEGEGIAVQVWDGVDVTVGRAACLRATLTINKPIQ